MLTSKRRYHEISAATCMWLNCLILALGAIVLLPRTVLASDSSSSSSDSSSSSSDSSSSSSDSKESQGSDGGTNIRQVDLMSGIPTSLVALVAFLQILPSPIMVAHSRLEGFLDWLQKNIESDFLNILTVEDLVKIVQSDNSGNTLVRLARVVRYPNLASFSRSVQIVEFCPTYGRRVIIWQWLVVIATYPVFWVLKGGLPTAVYWCCVVIRNLYRRTLHGLPPLDPAHNQRRVGNYCIAELARHRILSQHIPWVRFAIYYMAMELAGKQLSVRNRELGNANMQAIDLPSSVWYTENNSNPHVFQEDTDNNNNKKSSNNANNMQTFNSNLAPNENGQAFKNPMFHERLLCTHTATDECSTARLLFSVALHSTRCMLLCSQLGFVPPYILTGSFRTVDHVLCGTTMVVRYNDINVLYRVMYRLSSPVATNNSDDAQKLFPHCGTLRYKYSAYNHLMKGLQSQLGNMIKKSSNICLLLNLTLALTSVNDVELYIEAKKPEPKNKSSERKEEKDHDNSNSNSNNSSSVIGSTNTNTNTNSFANHERHQPLSQLFPSGVIDGVAVDSEVYAMLCGGYLETNKKLVGIINNLAKAATDSIHWGCGTWMLYLFNTALSNNVGVRKLGEEYNVLQCPQEVRAKIILLASLPYQLMFGIPGSFGDENTKYTDIIALGQKITRHNPLRSALRCNSVPAWCLCSGHCRGICTLLISELDMVIPFKWHFSTPYVFSISRQIEAETQAAALAPAYTSSASTGTTIRLVCITSISHPKCGEAATDNSDNIILELPVRLEDGQGETFNVDKQENGDDNGASKLAEMLYSKRGHVVVICGNTLRARGGGTIVVNNVPSDASPSNSSSENIWPYNFDEEWKFKLVDSERLPVNAVERLRLDGSDYQLGQMFATDSTRSEGILPHTRNINLAATGQLVLGRPHRSFVCEE
ncbi:hypothetical protein H4217_001023 [Coemansia sp. RSA 1939]|nr:hypothetical protein H4217_001023 [Coemansia sp. RSA 1939]